MYCRKCGKWIPDDSNYCNYCGNKITLDKKEKRAIWLPANGNAQSVGLKTV